MYWLHEKIRQDATVMSHGQDASGVYTEIQLEDGTSSQLKKARIGTATDAVLRILSVPRDFTWLAIRGIIAIGADHGRELSQNAFALPLVNLEPRCHVEARQDRRPYRYRGCS